MMADDREHTNAQNRPIAPIERTQLHDLVIDRLRELIVEGRVPAGERVNESELGRTLGVSRTPIREALKVLAAEGLVELSRNRGAIVPETTHAELRDTLLFMSAVEGFATEQAALNAQAAEIVQVRELHDAMIDAFERADRHRYFDLNQKIHLTIVELSRNQTLKPIHARLQARMQRLRYLGNDEPENWRVSVDEHKAIMEALERRDASDAGAAMRRHLENAIERIDTMLERQERTEPGPKDQATASR
ncbi:GntR family transcriptional regulator [Pelagibacterium montanilacus]|uniref:GntR family transcriptional regulator n=1 Tax=Pelagibacterium montanilacus TaxID=2185280 RepID=UPI000F8C3786|nr:GntR family transcriptional regulator [Pelagibacterium montanilacus]